MMLCCFFNPHDRDQVLVLGGEIGFIFLHPSWWSKTPPSSLTQRSLIGPLIPVSCHVFIAYYNHLLPHLPLSLSTKYCSLAFWERLLLLLLVFKRSIRVRTQEDRLNHFISQRPFSPPISCLPVLPRRGWPLSLKVEVWSFVSILSSLLLNASVALVFRNTTHQWHNTQQWEYLSNNSNHT